MCFLLIWLVLSSFMLLTPNILKILQNLLVISSSVRKRLTTSVRRSGRTLPHPTVSIFCSAPGGDATQMGPGVSCNPIDSASSLCLSSSGAEGVNGAVNSPLPTPRIVSPVTQIRAICAGRVLLPAALKGALCCGLPGALTWLLWKCPLLSPPSLFPVNCLKGGGWLRVKPASL